MKSCYLWILLLLVVVGATGCSLFSHNSIEAYKDRNPKVDLRTFFNGDVEGWGGIFDYSGSQISSFTVQLRGTWANDKQGTLEEWFEFDDGRKTQRKWDLTFSDDKMFVGQAADVVGDGVGTQMGNAINMNYTLRIPYKDSTLDVVLDDWIYGITPDVVLNRGRMKKFGFPVGEIVLVMKKKS